MGIKLLVLSLLLQHQNAFSFQGRLNVAYTRRGQWSEDLRKGGEYRCPESCSSVQMVKMPFSFASERASTATPPIRKRNKLIRFLLSFLVFSFITLPSSQARASTLAPQKVKSVMSKVPWKRVLQAVGAIIAVTSSIETYHVKKRQEKLATSEWGRYANNPMARGRATMWLFTQQMVMVILSKLLWFKSSEIRTFAGKHLANNLLKLGPLYIKLGQIISSRENLLGKEWIEAMSILQDQVPATTGDDALELAYSTVDGGKEEFESLFTDFDTSPLAAASLGQVHKAKLSATGDEVALKLQRPFLRQIYDQDLAVLTKVATFFDNMPGSGKNVGGVASSWTKIVEDTEAILYREIDYRDEASNAIRFANDFGLALGGQPAAQCTAKTRDGEELPSAAEWLRTPHVFEEACTERLLVMEFVPSMKITDMPKLEKAGVSENDKIDLANALARAYLRQLCCNCFFSTDPHAGNLGVEVLENGKPRLVMYDFGQAASITPTQADGILDIIEAIIDMNVDRSIEAFQKMGVLVDGADLKKVRAKIAENYRTGKVKANRKKLRRGGYELKEETSTESLEADEAEKARDAEVMSFFTLPAQYAFVARALAQMDGVGKVLDPEFDFISNGAPYIVEIKGANQYLKDEVGKFFDNFKFPGVTMLMSLASVFFFSIMVSASPTVSHIPEIIS